MTCNTVCYRVQHKQKLSTIPQENAMPLLYKVLHKYPRDIQSVKTEKLKFVIVKFLEFIPDESKMPNYVTAARINNILDSYLIVWLRKCT